MTEFGFLVGEWVFVCERGRKREKERQRESELKFCGAKKRPQRIMAQFIAYRSLLGVVWMLSLHDSFNSTAMNIYMEGFTHSKLEILQV